MEFDCLTSAVFSSSACNIDRVMQDCSISYLLAMEIPLGFALKHHNGTLKPLQASILLSFFLNSVSNPKEMISPILSSILWVYES